MLYSCYSRIQIMLMQQPTYTVFLGFIVNHRDRHRGEGSGTLRPPPRSLEYQITVWLFTGAAEHIPLWQREIRVFPNVCFN